MFRAKDIYKEKLAHYIRTHTL